MVFWRRRKHSDSEQGRYAYYAQELEPLKQQLADVLKVAKKRPVQRAELVPIERSLETLNKRMLDIWHEVHHLQQVERKRLKLEASREEHVKQDAAQALTSEAIVNQSFYDSRIREEKKGLLNKLKNLTRWL